MGGEAERPDGQEEGSGKTRWAGGEKWEDLMGGRSEAGRPDGQEKGSGKT